MLSLSQMYINAEERINGSHFRCLSIGNIQLKIGHKDSCFRTFEGNIYVLINIVRRGNSVLLIGNKFHQVEDYYTYPLPSSTLGILKVSNLDDVRHVIFVENVEAKCWLMPDGLQFFFMYSVTAYYAIIMMILLYLVLYFLIHVCATYMLLYIYVIL